MTNREIVLRAFSNRVGNLYKQAEPEQDLGGTYSYMQPDFYPGEGPQQSAIMKALSGLASGAKGYLGSAMSKSQDATMAALGRFKELDPTARAAILGGLGGAGVGGVGNAVLGNKKKSLIRRLGEGAGVGAAAGAGAGALGRLGKDKVYDPIKEKYIDPGIAEVGRVLGKGKDKLVKGVGKAKDKVVAETSKIKDKAMGAANSAKDSVVGAANSAAAKAKSIQESLTTMLTGRYPNQDMYEGEGDPISRPSTVLGSQRNIERMPGGGATYDTKDLSQWPLESHGMNRLLNSDDPYGIDNPTKPAPLLPDEAGISQNLKSIGRQRNPNMRLGDFPSSGRSGV